MGTHRNSHRQPDSVYFHTLCRDFCAVHLQTSLNFLASPVFISHFPLLSSPFLYYVDWLILSIARRNPSSFKGGWKEGRQNVCWQLQDSLKAWMMRELWTNSHQSFLFLSKSEDCSKLKEALEATDLQMRIEGVSLLLLHNIRPHSSGIQQSALTQHL